MKEEIIGQHVQESLCRLGKIPFAVFALCEHCQAWLRCRPSLCLVRFLVVSSQVAARAWTFHMALSSDLQRSFKGTQKLLNATVQPLLFGMN